jgi:hypothetical protein
MSEDPSVPDEVAAARHALAEAEEEYAQLMQVPDEFPDTCAKCGTKAPSVNGRCPNPHCKGLRKGTQIAAKGGPVNRTRRDRFHEQFIRDYRPSSTIDQIRCRQMADIAERLERFQRQGSSEYQRLIQAMGQLDSALRESLSTRQKAQPDVADIPTEDLISRLEQLLAMAKESLTPKPATDAGSEGSEGQSEPASGIFSEPPASRAAEKESASPSPSVIRHPPSIPIQLSDEERERNAAAIRRELGWNRGVLNERTGLWRDRE